MHTSSSTKASWYKSFDKSVKKPISSIGKMLIPYELYHTTVPRQVFYPDGADSSYDDMLERRREQLAMARRQKAENSSSEEKEPVEPEKRVGYYQVIFPEPEGVSIASIEEYGKLASLACQLRHF